MKQTWEQRFRDLATAANNMRRWQKAYFANRTRDNLERAKKWEREVDKILAGQGTLW